LPEYKKVSFLTRLSWLGRSGKTDGERIAELPMVDYQPTAIGYEKVSGQPHKRRAEQGKGTHNLRHSIQSLGGQALVNQTHCHEYLAMDDSADAIVDQAELLTDKKSYVRQSIDELTDRLIGYKPAVFEFPNALFVPSIWFFFLRTFVFGFGGFVVYVFMLGLGSVFSLFTDGLSGTVDYFVYFFTHPFMFYCFALLPGYWLVLKGLTYIGVTDLFDPAFIPGSALRRDLGTLRSISKKKGITEIPFEELEARTTTMWDGGNRAMCKLYLSHKYSKEGVVYGAPNQQAWYVGVLWEFFQHFMDVSRPLPDVPQFEPYRHLDPTTKKWDEENNRPRWVWRDMSRDDYRALVEASMAAAQAYPYLDPAAAKQENWKPAGDGKHWYQLG